MHLSAVFAKSCADKFEIVRNIVSAVNASPRNEGSNKSSNGHVISNEDVEWKEDESEDDSSSSSSTSSLIIFSSLSYSLPLSLSLSYEKKILLKKRYSRSVESKCVYCKFCVFVGEKCGFNGRNKRLKKQPN